MNATKLTAFVLLAYNILEVYLDMVFALNFNKKFML